MADLLIRDIDPELKRRIERQAQETDTSLSDAAKLLIQRGLAAGETPRRLGSELFGLVPPEHRVDLDCEIPETASEAPDFS
ncbi:hypothetical protein [Rhodopseudomonas palustris]|uniref:Plasmid stabilization protein n=1 Tax=Rhodopseudomonas palustris (strain BisB18) TaxID=316056 RepID=Q21B61_RHOPB